MGLLNRSPGLGADRAAWLNPQSRRALVVAGWMGVFVFAVGLVGFWINLFLLLLVMLATAVLWVVAGIVFTARTVRAAWGMEGTRRVRVVNGAAAPVAFLLLGAAALPLVFSGSWLSQMMRLRINESQYEAIAAAVERDPALCRKQGYQERDGTIFVLDCETPPLRIAFEPDGFLDNWSGIVRDPSGEVMLADGFDANGRFRAPERVTKLFGGDLVSCRPLWGPYYSCNFT